MRPSRRSQYFKGDAERAVGARRARAHGWTRKQRRRSDLRCEERDRPAMGIVRCSGSGGVRAQSRGKDDVYCAEAGWWAAEGTRALGGVAAWWRPAPVHMDSSMHRLLESANGSGKYLVVISCALQGFGNQERGPAQGKRADQGQAVRRWRRMQAKEWQKTGQSQRGAAERGRPKHAKKAERSRRSQAANLLQHQFPAPAVYPTLAYTFHMSLSIH